MSEYGPTLRAAIIVAVIGAFLNGVVTGVVGSWIAQRYSNEQTRKEAVHALSTHIYERRATAELVASSLRRGADLDELRERKRRYDEAYLNWNKNLLANLLRIRDVLATDVYSFFEQQTEFRLTAILKEIDACLTAAYDARLAGKEPGPLLDGCQMRSRLQESLDCGYAISNELYRIARVSIVPFWTMSSRSPEEAQREVIAKCGKA